MSKILIATVAVAALSCGSAFAQISQTESTTTVQSPSLEEPAGAVSKSVKSKTLNSDGSVSKSSKNVTRSGGGVSAQSKTQTVAPDGSAVTSEHKHDVAPDGSERSSTTTTEER